MGVEDDEKKRQGEAILQYIGKKYPYPWERKKSEQSSPDESTHAGPIDGSNDRAEARRRPRRNPKLWWTAVVAALCAAAGSLLWGAFFLTPEKEGETWTDWVLKGTVGVLIGSYLIDPIMKGRLPTLFHSRLRSMKVFQAVLSLVTTGLLADAYSKGILKSFDSIGEWGAISMLVGLITYAWLQAIGAPYVEATARADWFAVLGVLGFSLIGVAVEVNRINSSLVPGVAWSDHFPAVAWIDQTVNQWVFRTVQWSFIGRLGVWIVTRTASIRPVVGLTLAAFAAGAVLEVAYGVSLFLYPSLAMQYFNTSPGKVLFQPVAITLFWCAGIWLVTPRNLAQVQEPQDDAGTITQRLGHGTRLTILMAAMVGVALAVRFTLPPIAYTDPHIRVSMSGNISPSPYGTYNNPFTRKFPGLPPANVYMQAEVTVSHAPGQRSRKIPCKCALTDLTGNVLVESSLLVIDIPNTVSGPGSHSQTSWIGLRFIRPSKAGSYRVACALPLGMVGSVFEVRP
jgi:hypothetical protein